MKNEENTKVTPTAPISESDKKAVTKKTATASKQPAVEETAPHSSDTKLHEEELEEVLEERLSDETSDAPVEEAPEEPVVSGKKRSLLDQITLNTTHVADQKSASLEMICKKSGLTENDIYMMFELGYENELGRLVGYENLKKLKSDLQKIASQQESHRYMTSFGYEGKNFVSNSYRKSILATYISDRRFLIVRLLVTIFCSLLLFFIDQPSILEGTSIGTFAAQHVILWDALGLVLLIPIILLSLRPLSAGLRSFFVFSPTPYSFPAILTPIAVVYSVVTVIVPEDMLRINFLLSCVFLLMAVCDVLRLSCELRTFRMLSTEATKYVLTEAPPAKKKLRYNNKIVKILNDDLGKNIYEVHKTKQTVGFFRRFNAMDSASRPFSILIVMSLATAILLGFVATVYTKSLITAISLAMTSLMASMPLTFFLAFFYPICRANRILSRKECAVIGEESVEELEGNKTVVFRDTLLFSAEKSAEIAVRKNDDFHQDLLLAGALFRKLGGTTKKIGVKLVSPEEEPQISIVRIHEFGIEAMADNRIHLLAGSADFLRHSGVRVPRENAERAQARKENVSVMYFAIDGVLKLSYEIEYNADSTFENMIRDLVESDTSVAISSYDPNLNEYFLQQIRNKTDEPVSIRKPGRFEDEKLLDKADTPVIALRKETDLAHPLYAAKGISVMRHFGLRMQVIASLIGSAAVVLLMLFKPSAPLGIPSILAYQAIWLTIFILSAHAELSETRFRFRK